MRVVVISDLHLDKWVDRGDDPITDDAFGDEAPDVVIIAGDVSNGPFTGWGRALSRISEIAPGASVYLVPGNHDYYGVGLGGEGVMAEIAGRFGAEIAQKRSLVFGDVRFLCCTLWTDFGLFGDKASAMSAARDRLMDYAMIPSASGDVIRPEEVAAEHADHAAWLLSEMSRPWPGKTIVVTHHCPHPDALPGPITETSPAYGSDLSELIAAGAPDVWLFGHTHRPAEAVVRGALLRNVSVGNPGEFGVGYAAICGERGEIRSGAASPRHPAPESLLVRSAHGFRYVDLSALSGALGRAFRLWMFGKGAPEIDGCVEAAYGHDWLDFCERHGVR